MKRYKFSQQQITFSDRPQVLTERPNHSHAGLFA